MEPSPRSASTFISEPSAPYCLSGYKFSGRHSCSKYELERYTDEVKRYMQTMKEYAEEARRLANKYATEAAEYAVCQSNRVVNEYNSSFK